MHQKMKLFDIWDMINKNKIFDNKKVANLQEDLPQQVESWKWYVSPHIFWLVLSLQQQLQINSCIGLLFGDIFLRKVFKFQIIVKNLIQHKTG